MVRFMLFFTVMCEDEATLLDLDFFFMFTGEFIPYRVSLKETLMRQRRSQNL